MADVKLFRPERLTDNPDGGGLATATEVVDGQVNNLFDDISRIDRVNGDVSLRKPFVIAATADTELYSGLHVIVQAPPLDPRVSAVLFRTNDWDDVRDDAKSYVERYLDQSVISRMVPYDRQLLGQRTVLVFQRPELSLPEIGEVYALCNDNVIGAVEFVKLQAVDHAVETFTDDKGDFNARVITLTISQPLSQEFSGSQPNRYFTPDAGKSTVRKTIASDAARYKGVVVLAADAAPGDLSITVESIFAQLVPSATSEVSVADAQPTGVVSDVAAAPTTLTVTLDSYYGWPIGQHRYLTTGLIPGTLVIQRDGGSWNYVDDSKGNIIDRNAANRIVGSVNYEIGELVNVSAAFQSNTTFATYQPAVLIAKSGLSYQVPVQIQNRGYVYVVTLRPIPTPGSTVVSFRSQGKWYTLEDDGSGALRGESGTGVGQVNFQTGTVQITLGALPDIGSSVIIAFGSDGEYEIHTGDSAISPPEIRRTVIDGNIEPGTFSVSWLAGGITRTATDNGAGSLIGSGTGHVVYSTGEYVLRPTLLPDPSTEYVTTYDAGATQLDSFTPSMASGSISLQASLFPVRPRSVVIDYTGTRFGVLASYTRSRRLTDNGTGALLDESGAVITGSVVNYATGLVTFNPNFSAYVPEITLDTFANPIPGRVVEGTTGYYSTVDTDGNWATQVDSILQSVPFINGTSVVMRYKEDSTVDAAQSDTAPSQPLLIDFLPLVNSSIVPGGLVFALAGRTYYERNATLYYDMNPATGAGTAAGTVNYGGGTATLTAWVGGVAPALSIKSLLTLVDPMPLVVVHGRTPGSPLRPGTFYLQANRYRDGALVSAIADNNGNIETPAMHGYVDVNTGVFSVAFGAYVLDSSLSAGDKAEPWYSSANVDTDGYIWRPDEAIPGTVRFNCVVQTSLPQDPEIIGVNPVRLPSDGRVPIFRPGDTVVISDSLPYTLPNPLTAGQVVTLPRSALAGVAVYDALGVGLPDTYFAADLVAGELTFATPLNLSGYSQPLVAIHTVEDMALCTDAQITGQLQLAAALSHGYVAGQSVCSSALILGDVQARYEHLFSQNTWTNVWANDLVGSPPTSGAQFNDASFPVAVLNRDAITQRWALIFTSSTTFNIVGETLGVIGSGNTSTNVAPTNPGTTQPYFVVPAGGFGGGWSTGKVIRFNTVAAGGPMWMARTVLSGQATEQDDRIRLDVRWDKD